MRRGPEVDGDDQFEACLFVCHVCVRACADYFLKEVLRIEKLMPAVWEEGRLFNISKVSSRDTQRHKRVTGDADSSVNSAGG